MDPEIQGPYGGYGLSSWQRESDIYGGRDYDGDYAAYDEHEPKWAAENPHEANPELDTWSVTIPRHSVATVSFYDKDRNLVGQTELCSGTHKITTGEAGYFRLASWATQ